MPSATPLESFQLSHRVALITGDWNPLHTYSYLTSWLSDFLVTFAFYAQLPTSNAVASNMARDA